MMYQPLRPILLVEDTRDDVLLIQRAFRRARLNVALHVVNDGEAAVAYLAGVGDYADREQHPLPVLVLLDLKLPRRSGFEVLAWIRQQPGLQRLPVVMLTSSEQIQDVNRAYEVGANSYLVKPVGFDALLEMVRMLDLYWLLWNQKPEITGT
jgi:CheY-like chemotaxis protein